MFDAGAAHAARGSSIADVLVTLLDLAIVIASGAMLLYAVAGPVRVWGLSVSGLTQPGLQAFVLCAVRAAIARESRLRTVFWGVIEAARRTLSSEVDPDAA